MIMAATLDTSFRMLRPGLPRRGHHATLAFVDRIDTAPLRPPADTRTARASGLVRMAEAAGRLSRQRSDILAQLLRATVQPADVTRSAFAPIWAFDNVARTGVLIRLLLALDRLRKSGSPHMLSPAMERDAADRLSAGLSLLQDCSGSDPAPCSALLRHVVRDLVELFGPTAGDIAVSTQIETLAMPAVKRRALLLIACNLLLHCITDGAPGQSGRRLGVSLQRIGGGRVRLTVADTAAGDDHDRSADLCEAIDDMAAILAGRISVRRDEHGGSATDLIFRHAEP
jgi:hypothetical protein